MAVRRALVLTAGLGTRLRPLSAIRAKPAMPVARDPLIRRILRWLAAHDVADIVLNLHHLPHTVTSIAGDGSDLGVRIRYSWEQPLLLGSAGGPRHALPLLGGERFLLVNGDTLTDLDPRRVETTHARAAAAVTMALVPNLEPHRYGGVLVDADRRVTGFARRGPRAEGSYHFIGVQVVEPDVFAPLADGKPAQSIGGVYDDLIRRRPGSIAAHVCDARFWDIGTAADYLATSLAFASAEDGRRVIVGEQTTVARGASVTDSVLWDDVFIADDCVVSHCVVADHVHLPVGSRYDRMVVTTEDGALRADPIGR